MLQRDAVCICPIRSDSNDKETNAVCCSVLQCVTVCCSVLQCVAVCCSVLQGGCCSVLQCVAVCICPIRSDLNDKEKNAVCCSVAVICSVMQCVAVLQ